MIKVCSHCGTEKPIAEFYVCHSAKKPYHSSRCRECHRKYPRDRTGDNLRNRYGLTREQWHAIRAKENYKCMICGVHESTLPRSLMVDHCHRSKRVRGVLCQHCNTLLGMAKDKIAILHRAIRYLKTYRKGYRIPKTP